MTDRLTISFAWRVLSTRSEKLLELDLLLFRGKVPAVKPPGSVVVKPEPYKAAKLSRTGGDTVETVKLTVRLPKSDLEFAKQYAQAHRITVTELIDRYLRSLRGGTGAIHPEVEKISGLIPPEVDAKTEYREHALRKHR